MAVAKILVAILSSVGFIAGKCIDDSAIWDALWILVFEIPGNGRQYGK